MEPRFGHDFGQVRVHADTRAAESARAVNALAFTRGSNVVFGAGQFQPNTTAGQKLIAHELTHVLQQKAFAGVKPSSSGMSVEINSAAAAEVEADQMADRVLRIQPAVGSFTTSPVAIQRADAGTGGTDAQAVEEASTGSCESAFPCLRTPIPPGRVRFQGCTIEQLSAYAVIPETGTATTTPVNNAWNDCDGFWMKGHQPPTEWFKIPGHCDVTVTCAGNSFSCLKCCNLAASVVCGSPRWTSDHHDAPNPFTNT